MIDDNRIRDLSRRVNYTASANVSTILCSPRDFIWLCNNYQLSPVSSMTRVLDATYHRMDEARLFLFAVRYGSLMQSILLPELTNQGLRSVADILDETIGEYDVG